MHNANFNNDFVGRHLILV